MNISSKNIIGIKEFLANYLLNEKDAKNIESKRRNMSHDKMTLYLISKGYNVPNRISLKRIKKSDILDGQVLFVKDDYGKVIPYYNDRRISLKLLEKELRLEKNKLEALNARKNYLVNNFSTQIDSEDEHITCKINRNKVLANKNHKMRGMVG